MEHIGDLAEIYGAPVEDVLFLALNVKGVRADGGFNRVRTDFRLAENPSFREAALRKVYDYFFALSVNQESEFAFDSDSLLLNGQSIGKLINPMEDYSDLYYFRRKKTSLNFNPNARSACAGCVFCYTRRLTPNDQDKVETADDLKLFFENFMQRNDLVDLSHLIQISVVTGNYQQPEELKRFLVELRRVLSMYSFRGKIFYLGSQLTSPEQLESLVEAQPFGICYSIESFERRNLLRKDKRALTLDETVASMDNAVELGFEVNFSYIVGLEPLEVAERYLYRFRQHINKFPTINAFQMHQFHSSSISDPSANSLDFFLRARKIIERIFADTSMRPLVWEDYRSLWYLTFASEKLDGIRTP